MLYLQLLLLLVAIVLKLMGIYYKNYKREWNWNENEQKINTKRKCNILQRDPPNTKAILDLPAIKKSENILNTLVHIIFLQLFLSIYFPISVYICWPFFCLVVQNECESPLYACSMSSCFKRTFWHILREIQPKSIFIFNSCQLLEKLDCFCAAISHYQSLPCQAFSLEITIWNITVFLTTLIHVWSKGWSYVY